ncbi:helix-turn-helix domain-containing protein [Paenibacillus sp. Dod16]|uniref:helix-turn-helix domain-containing protein n=1 Tax=Paenibacillus sp. Dod16 TaxID=3416392 RepID=UPI003CF2BC1C
MKSLWQHIQTSFLRWFSANRYLKRLIWLGCLSAIIPVILAGSAYYHFSMKKLTVQFQENNMASLMQLKDRVENIITSIEHESLQLASGPLIRSALENPEYETDYMQQLDMLKLFQLHKNTNNLIEDILFYDVRHRLLLSHSYGLVHLDGYKGKEDIEQAVAREGGARWMHLPKSTENGYVSYVRHLPVMVLGQPRGTILIQVKEESLRSLLNNYTLSLEEQSLAILDSDHRVLLHTDGRSEIGKAAEEDPILVSLVESGETSGHDVLTGEDGKELVAFYKTSMGRLYVSRMPEREMIEQLRWIRVLIVMSVSVFMLIAVLLTWFSSKIAYNPIQQLLRYGEHLRRNGRSGADSSVKENEIEYIRSSLSYLNEQAESLNSYIRKIQPDLRERFLQRLLLSGSSWRSGTLEEGCVKYMIPMSGPYATIVVKVENPVKKRFLPNEGPVIVFAVKNVMSELLANNRQLEGYVVDREDREAVALLRPGEPGVSSQELRSLLACYAESVSQSLARYLSFSASIGIGNTGTLSRAAESYKEAQLALQYRLFHDADTVLFYEDMIRIERNPVFMYPKDIESEMIEYLWNGDLPQAEASLHEFSRRIRVSESYNVTFQSYYVLLSAIVQSMEEKGPGVLELLGGNLFDQLKENQTSREMHDWFIGALFPLYQEISHDLRTRSTRLIVQRVCGHISRHPDGAHSLADCAELVGVSPSYLSRLFKKEMGVSFVEYVMNSKVQKAKQLLKDTDYTVMEIAEIVGYSERNLNRAFQRFLQMSPRQYRLSVR